MICDVSERHIIQEIKNNTHKKKQCQIPKNVGYMQRKQVYI